MEHERIHGFMIWTADPFTPLIPLARIVDEVHRYRFGLRNEDVCDGSERFEAGDLDGRYNGDIGG